MTFKDLKLEAPILKALEKQGYSRPTPIQEQAIPILLKGHDLLGVAQTGTGKTAAFGIPILNHLLKDKKQPNRVAGAVGFNVRTGDFYVFQSKAVIVGAGGASHIFKPHSAGEGMGRTWYAPWSSGSAYALPIRIGAKMTQMENRIVLTRFKDYRTAKSFVHCNV